MPNKQKKEKTMEKQPITDKQPVEKQPTIVNQLKQPKNYMKIITVTATPTLVL